jgi:hypothetical protein
LSRNRKSAKARVGEDPRAKALGQILNVLATIEQWNDLAGTLWELGAEDVRWIGNHFRESMRFYWHHDIGQLNPKDQPFNFEKVSLIEMVKQSLEYGLTNNSK